MLLVERKRTVARLPTLQIGISVGDGHTDDGEGGDVDDDDSPESLLYSGRKGFPGVGGFGRSETDELGASERERGGDEHLDCLARGRV